MKRLKGTCLGSGGRLVLSLLVVASALVGFSPFPVSAEQAPVYRLYISYEYEDGTEAATPYTGFYELGESYSVLSPDILGYAADVREVSGGMVEDVVIIVTYSALPESEPETEITVSSIPESSEPPVSSLPEAEENTSSLPESSQEQPTDSSSSPESQDTASLPGETSSEGKAAPDGEGDTSPDTAASILESVKGIQTDFHFLIYEAAPVLLSFLIFYKFYRWFQRTFVDSALR